MGDKSKTETKQDNTIDPYTKGKLDRGEANVRRIMGSNPFRAFEGERIAGLNQTQQDARELAQNPGQGTGMLDRAAAIAQMVGGFSPDRIEGRTVADADLSAYRNPFQQDVIDATVSRVGRERDLAQQGTKAAATAAGAFGGSRHGVAEAETNRAFADIMAQQVAALNAQGFDRATQLAGEDADRLGRTDLANAQLGMQGQQLRLGAGQTLAGIGDSLEQNRRADASLVSQLGSEERNLEQARLDAIFSEFLRAQQDPWMRANMELSLMGMTPTIVDSEGTQTTTQTPGAMSIASGLMGGLSAMKGAGFFGGAGAGG